jgi:hypothetical protein
MNRRQLQERIEGAWATFQGSYAGLDEAQMLEPGVTGRWSVRDIIAHVTTWEQESLAHLPTLMEGGRAPKYSDRYGGIDAFNALKTEEKAGLPLREVFLEQEETHRRLLEFIDQVPEEHFATETRFRRRLRYDTYGHYPLHAEAILRWRADRPGGTAWSASGPPMV